MAKVATGAKIALTTIFVTFVGLPLTTTHMCRASELWKHNSQICLSLYTVVKTNHGSAYCRYRLRDNHEEPQNTPDTLKTGTIGENLAPVQPEIKLDPPLTIIIRFLSLIQMVEVRINPMEANTDLNIESKLVLLPEANKQILILIFLLGDSNTLILMKVSTGDILPPTFPSPGFNNTMASDTIGRSIIQLAENQSCSLAFYFSWTTISDGRLQGNDML